MHLNVGVAPPVSQWLLVQSLLAAHVVPLVHVVPVWPQQSPVVTSH
jgi:hypothetical protein